mmetsp:Transcript_15656/g.23064  ORF Transcript_15656/g.23064 Transcript_15656/m.23064 type:complete len:97 (+) Transcript_15656:972-1262(+)
MVVAIAANILAVKQEHGLVAGCIARGMEVAEDVCLKIAKEELLREASNIALHMAVVVVVLIRDAKRVPRGGQNQYIAEIMRNMPNQTKLWTTKLFS